MIETTSNTTGFWIMDWSEKTIEGGKNRIEGSDVLLVGNAVVLGRRLVLFAPPSTVLGGVCGYVFVSVYATVLVYGQQQRGSSLMRAWVACLVSGFVAPSCSWGSLAGVPRMVSFDGSRCRYLRTRRTSGRGGQREWKEWG